MSRVVSVTLFILVFALVSVGLYVRYAQGESMPYSGGFTVEIDTDIGVGSGFYIGDGYVITANHVVEGVETGKIITDMGAFRAFTVMWRNEDLDIALILVDEPINLTSIDIDCSPPDNEAVVMHGLPHGIDFVAIPASIGTREYRDVPAAGGEVKWKVLVLVSTEASPGMSGGPVVDRDGNVVAVIVGGGDGSSVAVPAQEVCKLLP